MASLVPYALPAMAGAKRAAQIYYGARAFKRARTAASVGRHLYNNRKTYARAARVIGRAWRRRRKAPVGPSRYGMGKRVAKTKRWEAAAEVNQTESTRTLYYDNLISLSQTTTNEIDKRQRRVAYISGFKICAELKNQNAKPMLCNIALVHDRRTNEGESIIPTDEFFRANSGNVRAKEFGVLRDSHEFHCSPLNTDRFTVIRHWRFKLAPNPVVGSEGFTSQASMNNWRTFERYVPIKKNFAWNDTQPQSKLWLMRWYDGFQQATGTAAISNAVNFDMHVTGYFREPKNCAC